MSINDDILYKIDSEIGKDKKVVELQREIERLNQEIRGLNNCIIGFHSEFCNKQAEINRLNNIIFNQNKRNSHQRIANDNLQNKNKELNNIINELNNAYCKVITKCEEMINSRFYMNDIAIKKYADEIKDICRYYVGKAKELKGDDKE